MPTAAFVCRVELSPPLAHVTVKGRIDPHTTPELRRSVLGTLAAEPDAVLIDLAGVTGTEPIALTAFVPLARAAAAWPGADLVHHSASPALARELEDLAIGRHVPLAADRAAAEALAAGRSRPVQVRWEIPEGPDALSGARDVVRMLCAREGLSALAEHAELVVMELVVNALEHGVGPRTALASVHRRRLHLAVRDHSPAMPRLGGAAGTEAGSGGRGLVIVEAFTTAWGATPTPDGKIVWCTLGG
ncbi:ATP-binding protein [Dactylosporangium sp. NPDC006015]|uniref:ATP-binding protein n=1 Tax=Dactylosporangium sp. NPDC006015 TaxID=3154576 RepID=UPI0033AF754F